MAEASLVKVARSLDQSGPETVVSKLQHLWDALAATSASTATPSSSSSSSFPPTSPEAGRFHASEEVALRWLLKNMHAAASGPTSREIETLRRWPLTWRILACIFARIPLFSLAKSLADRRFIAVLQQTAKDLATPTTENSDDQSSRKRKRWHEAQFDLASLREPQHCVVSAAALFEALRVLLARLDDAQDGESASLSSPFNHMGVEHIKSFFSVPAADANILLKPLLKTCRLALFTEEVADAGDSAGTPGTEKSAMAVALKGQASWISTFATLWDLHLQGPNDAFDVSGRLASDGLTMLGHLLNISSVSPGGPTSQLDPELQRRWSIGLQRFFTNNLVLPARSLFLNNKDVSAISIATSNATAKADADGYIVRVLALFYLALRAPRLLSGSSATSRTSESWLPTVFEIIRESLMSTNAVSADIKNTALADLLDLAAENGVEPSVDSLEQVCEKRALQEDDSETDWRLLASVARCNADVFLLSDKGKGFAKNRNVSGFITHWYTGISALGNNLTQKLKGHQAAWLAKDLRDAVAASLQSSMTEENLMTMIAQVEKGTSELASSSGNGSANAISRSVARLVVVDALSASIHSEALEDAVQTKLLDSVLGLILSSKLSSNILAIKWRVIRRTLAWVGFVETERIWAAVKSPLQSLLSDSTTKRAEEAASMLREDMFEAFISCFSIWMALKFGGQAEQEARETTWDFFKRFQEELSALENDNNDAAGLLHEMARQTTAGDKTYPSFGGLFGEETTAAATYLTWMLCGSSRFIDEMVKSSEEPSQFLEVLLSWQPRLDARKAVTPKENSLSALVFGSITALQNQKVTSSVAESLVKRLEDAAGNRKPGLQSAANSLLQMPSQLLSRTQRDRIVSVLLPSRPKSNEAAATLDSRDASFVLDLLTKVTRERAFDDVGFDRIVYLGETIHTTVASKASDTALGIFDRFQQVAKAVVKSSGGKADCAIPQSIPLDIQLVLYAAKLSALKGSSLLTAEAAQLLETKETLAPVLVKQLLGHLESNEDVNMSGTTDGANSHSHLPLQLLLVFNAAMADNIQLQLSQQKKFSSLIKKAKKEADARCAAQEKIGWKWKAFIARYTRGKENRPSRDVLFQGLFLDNNGQGKTTTDSVFSNKATATAASVLLDSDLLRDYLAGETTDYDQETLLQYVEEVINALDAKREDETSSVGQFLAIQYLLARLLDTPNAAMAKTAGGFHLGVIHSKLAQRLPQARTATECKLIAQTLRTLLVDDKAAAAMGQWNIDATLCAAASVVSGAGVAVHSSVTAYNSACQLVEAVLKRHRVRLEGRFHLMVSTLQALLVRLVAGHQDELKQKAMSNGVGTVSASTATIPSRAAQAKRFSRLLELICEPSTAAVTMMTLRKGGEAGGAVPLHSATDAAKRSAGQHMYLVLMTYIKLQTDGVSLSVGVRDALEPGFFSILTITPDEIRRLLNGAVDANGQTLFKRLYNSWLKGGKWKGV
ncbi:hypothetical protein SCUCBS95973_004309 [Sporothrix curviconia]|uniref:Nucleolar 27S pre-rRNA processing Urb2/Npa2 C-terminal domain-containing protein n=1 Tax=Sporothrix curviconia TaxID=1260050 RepID=A0ABP0BMZ8_9PEZI